jgi:hypothetical protein
MGNTGAKGNPRFTIAFLPRSFGPGADSGLVAEGLDVDLPEERPGTSMFKRWWERCRRSEGGALLWVGGLAVLQVVLANHWLALRGEAYEWAQYLLLGTLFPALVLALARAGYWWPRLAPPVGALKLGLALFGLVYPFLYLWRGLDPRVALLAVVHGAVMALLWHVLRRRAGRSGEGVRFTQAALGLAVATLSWAVSVKFFWWASLVDCLGGSAYFLTVFLLAAALALITLCQPASPGRGRGKLRSAGTVAALVILALASVRFNGLDYEGKTPSEMMKGTFHHWGVIAGPAALVRQGGWLLWDVPAQYGFLSTLTLACFPAGTVWQAVYAVTAVLLFLVGAFFFLLLRSLRPGLLGGCWALALTLAAFFLLPGWAPLATGPLYLPCLGPFRFFWCYALLAVLLWEYRSGCDARLQRRVLWVGSVTWLAGTLWCSESAVYCAAVWLPAFALIVWRRVHRLRQGPGHFRARVLAAAGWLLVPLGLLGASVAGITAYYAWRLGHGPDWYAFVEYSLAFQNGFAALPIDPRGCVWVLLLVFCILSALVARALACGLCRRELGLLVGAWAALWSTASYFVSRSHENNATCLAPVLCTGAALALYVCGRGRRRGSWLLNAGLAPLLTVVLAAGFANPQALKSHWTHLWRGYRGHVERLLVPLDPQADFLLAVAGVKADDPILVVDYAGDRSDLLPPRRAGAGGEDLVSVNRAWLPAYPFTLLLPLPEERRLVYLARFHARARRSGWLLQAPTVVGSFPHWFMRQVQVTHTPGKALEFAGYRLQWFECKAPAEEGHATAAAR